MMIMMEYRITQLNATRTCGPSIGQTLMSGSDCLRKFGSRYEIELKNKGEEQSNGIV